MNIDDIIGTISMIEKIHYEFSNSFYSESFYSKNGKINLKKTTIRKILSEKSNISFIKLVENYSTKLQIFLSENNEYFQTINKNYAAMQLRYRIKQFESALRKLYHYNRKQENVPIQKCLNDIFGCRLIINKNISYEQLKERLENCQQINIFRPYVRKEDQYQALHMLIKMNNAVFPWEIQIWKKEDNLTNEQSHKKHKEKREYLGWTHELKVPILKE